MITLCCNIKKDIKKRRKKMNTLRELKKEKEKNKKLMRTYYFTADTLELIENACKKEGLSKSEIIEFCVINTLQKETRHE
jgi:hypothetical protein